VRSITIRLALLFFTATLVTLAVVYLYVAPQLESKLREQKLKQLAQAAHRFSGPISRGVGTSIGAKELDARVRHAADQTNARVTLLFINRGTQGLQALPRSDSTSEVEIPDLQFDVAVDAARTGRITRGSEAGNEGPVGEAALPLRVQNPRTHRKMVAAVVVFSAPLSEVQDNVELIRRRILVAGAIALAVALIFGVLIARSLTLRVRRLETTAQRVAAGDFSARFRVDSNDELGQLARSLDDMQRQLAGLDDARKQFIATASHELRTPIFSLSGFLELLQDEDMDDETRAQFLGQLREQVDRLGKLATDLLDLSRLEAGSLDLRPEEVDLGVLARAVANEFSPRLTAHDSHLELRLTAEPVQAVCDPERVGQIMRILIDNALTHTPPGTDMVVSAMRRDGELRVEVEDFGPGIKRASLRRVFEPFYTADHARGSGLGLAIASELAEHMNGRLTVNSAPGRTTFALEMPA
jgi:two-component system, OmpR family, sensor kinase